MDKEKKRKKIPLSTTIKLWAVAGGRCEYCNTVLWKDSLTGSDLNKSYIAHIRAVSKGGPRWDKKLSSILEKDISNLMLLCDECHNRIDKSQVNEHNVERLEKIKKEHEFKIKRLTGLASKGKKAYTIVYGATIGNNDPPFNNDQIIEALLNQGIYPIEDLPLKLSLENSSFRDKNLSYWKVNEKQLCTTFRSKIQPIIENINHNTFAVFALAPQPLLVKFGTLFSDIQNVMIFQKHREPDNWTWLKEKTKNGIIVSEPTNKSLQPILIFALSAKAIIGYVKKAYPTNTNSLWIITCKYPSNDMLRNIEQLKQFRIKTREVLDKINSTSFGFTLKVFMAMPAACAFELGRICMPKADLSMELYDRNVQSKNFIKTLTIK